MNGNRRGRPIGYRLSEESKRAISESKKGQRHTQETRDKISKTLVIYFRSRNPLSEELINNYCRSDDDELCEWLTDYQEELDSSTDVLTERTLQSTRKIEIAFGQNIEFFSHELTPEILLLFKETCMESGLDVEEALSIIGGNI